MVGKFAINGFVTGIAADRGLQPFADRKAGTARRFAGGVPGLGFDRVDAPGDIVTHQGPIRSADCRTAA
jgi:hypothetical protein